MTPRLARRSIYVCFLLSGAAALIYEVVWARQLALFLGITAYAHTAVLTAYMAGLALGAALFGRLADRLERPLAAYAWLELGIGLYAALTPWLFAGMTRAFALVSPHLPVGGPAGYLLRFAAALVALLVPTVWMGGTLPLAVRQLAAAPGALAPTVGRLYGVNTMGATVGTLMVGYVLLPRLGSVRSLIAAAVLSFLAAGLAALVARASGPAPSAEGDVRGSAGEGGRRLVLAGFAVSGFAALLYQLAWVRLLTLVTGASVYALSLTLAVFLAGIAVGSLLYAALPGSWQSGLAAAGWLAAAAGVAALVGMFATSRLPGLFLSAWGGGAGESFASLQMVIAGLSALVMLAPTVLLGTLFPLLTGLASGGPRRHGRAVGHAYAANTVGTLLGALVTGLVLLPWLGVQRTVVLGASLHVSVGAAFLTWRSGRRRLRLAAAAVVLSILAGTVWVLPAWERQLMVSGVFARPRALGDEEGLRRAVTAEDLLYYAEGVEGTVAVLASSVEKRLVLQGKTDATSHSDLPTQVLLGQLPLLMRPAARDVLMVGLGSGITAHSVLTHPTVERLDVVELSPEVVEAARLFADENRDALEDPRLSVMAADARSYLYARPKRYDVIVSEPSNPWISGVSNLFTREAFELARSRLRPGGLMSQWFHTYAMDNEDLRGLVATFGAVFPHVSVWMPLEGDLVLLGSDDEHSLDLGRLEDRLREPAVRRDLERIDRHSTGRLVRSFLLAGPDLRSWVAGAELNTDDRPRIEFNAPRHLYRRTSDSNLVELMEHGESGYGLAPVSLRPPEPAGAPVELPGTGLRVRLPAAASTGWSFEWRVGRRALRDLEGDLEIAVTSRRALEWGLRGAASRLEMVDLPARPAAAAAQAYLTTLLGAPEGSGSKLEGPGPDARWAAAVGRPGGARRLALTWTCGVGEGLWTRYGLTTEPGDPEGARLEDWAVRLAARFECAG